MELLYLIGSVFKALTISFLYTLQLLCKKLLFSKTTTNCAKEGSGLVVYEGKVWHERRKPVVHSFEYNVRYALINLDDPPPWFLPVINNHHMDSQQVRSITGTSGPVYLLTIPTSVGYEQNPLSVYYCYDAEGPTSYLKLCIAEVTNTPWAERVSFVFNPKSDLLAKPLHVSPFMDMLGDWKINASAPGSSLTLTITVQHPELGKYFTANLQVKKIEQLTVHPEVILWLMPHKVAVWIYWQAFQLWWKGVPFIQHPKYVNGNSYREEALRRDSQLQSSKVCGQNVNLCKTSTVEMNRNYMPCLNTCNNEGGRWCVWRDAQWPWL